MKILLLIAVLLPSQLIFGQNADFTITPQNLAPSGQCNLGDTVIIKVTIRNVGGTPLRKGSVLATLDVPSNAAFAGLASGMGGTTQFAITSVYSTKIEMINTVGKLGPAPFDPTNTAQMYIKLKAINVGGPVTFKALVQFNPYNGTDSLNSYMLQGNNGGNDQNQTSMTVVSPLPVTFLDVTSKWSGDNSIITWSVAQESDVDYYGIERSFDGYKFETIGKVKSLGNNQHTAQYAFTDKSVRQSTAGMVFYRIKEMALTGHFTLSKITILKNEQIGTDLASIYPNPVSGSDFTLLFENNTIDDTQLDLVITDAMGRIIYKGNVAVKNGKNRIPIQGLTLASGIYNVHYSNSDYNIDANVKIVKE